MVCSSSSGCPESIGLEEGEGGEGCGSTAYNQIYILISTVADGGEDQATHDEVRRHLGNVALLRWLRNNGRDVEILGSLSLQAEFTMNRALIFRDKRTATTHMRPERSHPL